MQLRDGNQRRNKVFTHWSWKQTKGAQYPLKGMALLKAIKKETKEEVVI